VVKACVQMAIKPLVVLAKHIFRPEAVPIWGDMYLAFRVVARCAPDLGAEARGCGPDVGMLGLVQEFDKCFREDIVVTVSVDVWRRGAPPMIPPSIAMAEEGSWKSAAISRALRGEIALSSRKYKGVSLGGDSFRAVITLWAMNYERLQFAFIAGIYI
jgi:hypothetical protein